MQSYHNLTEEVVLASRIMSFGNHLIYVCDNIIKMPYHFGNMFIQILNKSGTVWGPGENCPCCAPLSAALVTNHLGSVFDTVIEHLKASLHKRQIMLAKIKY